MGNLVIVSLPEELRQRTKKFALRVSAFSKLYLKPLRRKCWENSFCAAVHPLRLIIVRHAEGDPKLNLLQDWGLLLNKLIRVFSG
jgi:hypothetical protein